jgi:hypothetical protein
MQKEDVDEEAMRCAEVETLFSNYKAFKNPI